MHIYVDIDTWVECGAGSYFPFVALRTACFTAQIFLQLTCAVIAACLHVVGRMPCAPVSALNTARNFVKQIACSNE